MTDEQLVIRGAITDTETDYYRDLLRPEIREKLDERATTKTECPDGPRDVRN